MASIKDILVTLLVGLVLGEILLLAFDLFNLPFPLHEGKRPLFIIGILLFSLAFRILVSVRDESAKD